MLIGWGSTRYLRVMVVEEKFLPKPVIEPETGMRWVRVKTTGYCPCSLWGCVVGGGEPTKKKRGRKNT